MSDTYLNEAPRDAAPAAPLPPAISEEDAAGRAGGKIILTLLGGVLLIAASIAHFTFPNQEVLDGEPTRNAYASGLAIVAALMLGLPLVVQAVRDLWQGRTQMNELAALAVVAAFASEMYLTSGAIAFFMILSNLIESRTALGARRTIERLLRLTPTRALRLNADGSESEVEARDLRPGDVVRVRPGDNLPGDGVVVRGYSTLNQANITGESIPVDKTDGDEVFGGTTNLTGALDVRITHAGKDTTLGKVQELVLQAEHTKTSTQRIADHYASYHTPVMVMLALIVLFFTKDMGRAIALLVIASPAGIILATPTAMIAAISAAARLGILIKNVGVLERARNLSAVVLDKTGTLTTGKLSVSRLGPVEGVTPAELLAAALSVEQNSNHPAARAVQEVGQRARVAAEDVSDFEEVSGRGVRGNVAGEAIYVGRSTWLDELGVDTTLPPDNTPPEGFSLLHVARGGRLLGWIGLEDKVRPDAADAVDLLRAQGVRQVVMVSGDRWSVANRVAAETHCTDVQAEVLPADKLKVVEGLKQRGHIVAVVGDGVNDAPALAAGDLSIAMGAAGSDIAISSAAVALMNNRLDRIPFLQRLAKQTGRVVLQGIAISVGFIVIFGALAAANVIGPVTAAILHAVSSIVVVFNSARLVRQGEEMDATPVEETMPVRRETITPMPVRAGGEMAVA